MSAPGSLSVAIWCFRLSERKRLLSCGQDLSKQSGQVAGKPFNSVCIDVVFCKDRFEVLLGFQCFLNKICQVKGVIQHFVQTRYLDCCLLFKLLFECIQVCLWYWRLESWPLVAAVGAPGQVLENLWRQAIFELALGHGQSLRMHAKCWLLA